MLKKVESSSTARLPEGKYLLVINALLFNIGWAACVLLRDQIALFIALSIVLFHLFAITRLKREWLFIVTVLLLGLVVDRVMVRSGLLQPTASEVSAILWMGALWPMLASTLNHSLAVLKDRMLFSALVGAVSGPFAYWTAVRLGAAEAGVAMPAFIVSLSLLWGLLLPLLYWLARKQLTVR
ncbi:MAG: DUF2878 domain-containing protein [Pseudomonadales bacterium]